MGIARLGYLTRCASFFLERKFGKLLIGFHTHRDHFERDFTKTCTSGYLVDCTQVYAPEDIHYAIVGTLEVIVEAGILDS